MVKGAKVLIRAGIHPRAGEQGLVVLTCFKVTLIQSRLVFASLKRLKALNQGHLPDHGSHSSFLKCASLS